MKKKIKLLMLAAIYLGICWGIGRFRQVKNFVDSQGADQNMSLADQETADVWKKAVFEGNQKTDDTPWGMTAGWFEMEEEGSCILLLPDTNVTFDLTGIADEISFCYQIHPWVKESSDGVGLIIDLYDEENCIIEKTELKIGNKDGHHKIGITHFRSCRSLQLTGSNDFLKKLLHTWLNDMQLTLISHFYNFGININPDNLNSVFSSNNRSRQANIAQPHKTCFHINKSYLFFYDFLITPKSYSTSSNGYGFSSIFLNSFTNSTCSAVMTSLPQPSIIA